MSESILLLVIGMAVVTYVPRMLPFVLLKEKELPGFLQEMLRNVPYATLGALIFPGIFFFHENTAVAAAGAAVAFGIAFTGANIIFTVIGAIAVTMIVSFFI